MRRGGKDAGYYLGTGLALWSFWVITGAIGRTFGAFVTDPGVLGVDFVAVAVFLALLIPMWEAKASSLLPWLTAGAVAWMLYALLPGTWCALPAAGAGSLVGGAHLRGRPPP